MPAKTSLEINLSCRPGEFRLEFGKIGTAFVDDHYLPVNDGLSGNVEGAGDLENRLVQSRPLRV